MPNGLIMEFEGPGREEYEAVNARLGVDPTAGSANWPVGLRFHAAGGTASSWVVFEIWDSMDAHQLFTDDRLAPALQDVGYPGPPSRVEWVELAAVWSAPEG